MQNHTLPTTIESILQARLNKLEQLKPLISLKSYDMLTAKLSAERSNAYGESVRAAHIVEKRERPQVLPKGLFTQRSLPRKVIRIDIDLSKKH